MKRNLAAAFIAITLLTVAATPVRSAAQSTSPEQKRQTPRYRLIDLGTLGGPNSAEDPEFPFINNRGVVVGFADTALPDPNHPGGFAFHAFRWRKGPIRDLGTLPGGVNSFAIWSNNHGLTVGFSENGVMDSLLGGPEGRGVLWRKNGRVVDLGTLGGNQSLAANINDRGQIVGVAANAIPDPFSLFGWGTQTRAFLWEKGSMRDLGTLGGPDADARFVNQRGQVAGVAYTNSTPNPATEIPTLHPFLWQHGTMLDLGTLGGTAASANALNNRGQVVGESNLAGDETAHPFLWDRGTLKDLGTLGGSFGVATWLNDAGEIAGGALTAGDEAFHAFFWRRGVITDLGTVNDDTCSVAHFMNAKGQVVGTSEDCDGEFQQHGFLSQQGDPMIDLNAFVPPGSDLTVIDGETINDRGEIAGSGLLPNGDIHAVVLLPCDDHQHGDSHGCRNADQHTNATPSRPAPGTSPAASAARPKLKPSELEAKLTDRYFTPRLPLE